MDIPLLSNPEFCGPSRLPWLGDEPFAPTNRKKPLVTLTLKNLLSGKRPRQQPPSAIFSLPPEMLAEIFLQAVSEDRNPPFPMHSHFVLAQVCALWRAVAIHTPSLWCRIVLEVAAHESRHDLDRVMIRARTCFERSHALPIALILTSSNSNPTFITNFALDLILPVRQRIRHLETKLPVGFTESLFKLPRNSFEVLKSITVTALVSDGAEGPWFRGMSALQGAPVLEHFTLTFPSCCWRPREIFDPYLADLPWEQLTELSIETLETRHEDALYALQLLEKLVRCRMDIRLLPPLVPVIAFTNGLPAPVQQPATDIPAPKAKISLLTLRVLEVMMTGVRVDPNLFFDRLALPSLTELSIKLSDRLTFRCKMLTDLQTRSSFSLRHFTLANARGESVLPFIENNPLLLSLKFAMCGMDLLPVATALTLTPTPDNKAFTSGSVPRLRLLSLGDHWREEGRPTEWASATKAVIDMVRSRRRRMKGASRLEGFIFGSSQAALSPKKKERLERWCAEGMRGRAVLLPHPPHPHLHMIMRVDDRNYLAMLDF
ncbi:F-box domain-containing protein [Favolaschia claudopus]|uniref:F-box domain-containing protein n=1 Tax=Favolaschia claudopus TaxID=2862362 RepID=A0AAW0CPU8_9AGAR